ncbi:hypothetical protein CROQUDRAFT_98174 [Cronartium quercuum f. sp. fusiforme G11]|uniref:Uncharacterized protein n=1 Tax=Cronartium quercuum f. sp. fusiforme G11 TaxID=708437 RepID=A0A9P6NDZ7_9BASI|nr:hypothetical protein CROQUDRAFT_98174 [Cronartium quercuum f. sp. fusiforme G11]
MSSPAQQNLAYSQLSEYIQTIRDRVDAISDIPDAQFVEPHTPTTVLKMNRPPLDFENGCISDDVFENPGSDEWQRAYTCANLLVGSSHKIREDSADISNQQDLCPLCLGPYLAGGHFIRLTCASHSRVHERCVMTMKNLEVVKLACPSSHGTIEAPHDLSMHLALQMLEQIL